MNKIFIFILLFLSAIGILGGVGYTIYNDAWPLAVGLVGAGYLAWPEFKRYWKKLNNDMSM